MARLTHRPGEDQVFTGIDEVDWTSLRHAHGDAGDVPGWLRGLASEERGEREAALDALYGAVLHEGGVYDATLAAVPFLLAVAAREGGRDRAGVLELLSSIGGDPGRAGSEGGSGAAAVRAGAESFVALTLDPDPAVRRAAVTAVVRFLDDPSRVLPLLSRRLRFERDDDALIAVTEAVGLFVRRHPAHAGEAIALLTTYLPSPNPPVLRLAVLGQLAAHAPDRLPPDLVALTARLLQERSSQAPRAYESPGAEQTLTGRLHRLRPSDEQGARLMRTLHTALADDIPTRTALLQAHLRLPSPTDRCNAVLLCAGFIREWRGDHSGLVTLIGEQLASGEGRLRDAAVSVLGGLYGVGAPAADRLYSLVAGRPERWVERWRAGARGLGGSAGSGEVAPGGEAVPGGPRGSAGFGREAGGPGGPVVSGGGGGRGVVVIGGALLALARCGDRRAVGVLEEVLGDGELPRHAASLVPCLGAGAAALAPALRRHLEVVPLEGVEAGDLVRGLLVAVGGLRDPGAVPGVVRVLESGGAGLAEAAFGALEAMGSAAREALPVVRGALSGVRKGAAAAAYWAIEPDVSLVLPVLRGELSGGADPLHRARTARRLSRLGPAARPALPRLRRLMTDSPDPGERVSAACAITSITGGVERDADTVLRSAWQSRPHTRVPIATTLTTLAPEAAAPLLDLAATELTHRRRHTTGVSGEVIVQDENLLALCRSLTAHL
ncbi:HEAT repeat domain-containing protein [Streptomyces niveiscabiei]|uniref:HEAT repeat domain-containing protein n=1 Tax=Streptomyces TaxID=1883 RepID=UPI001F0C8314|nr:HEAT repeat domain-containing protein [Streptomyces sp. V2]